jgi:hypothetical protein
LEEPDDWTQLLASSALLTLGEGGPHLSYKRNELVAKGTRYTSQFIFPLMFQNKIHSKELLQQLPELFDLAFLDRTNGSWLNPQFFDPLSPNSKYFLTSPHDFAALAAEVLDPRAETRLAQWRQTR